MLPEFEHCLSYQILDLVELVYFKIWKIMSKSDGFKRFYHQVSTLHSLFTVLISYLHQIYIVSLIYNTLRRRHHIIKRCSIFFFICSCLVTSLLFLLICPILFDIETLSSEVSSFIRKHLVARADHS